MSKNITRMTRLASGLCADCGSRDLSTGTMCETCREKNLQRTRQRRERLRQQKKCRCGRKTDGKSQYCRHCLDTFKSQRNQRKDAGFCAQCGVNPTCIGRLLCKKCATRSRDAARTKYGAMKDKILAHYGAACKCCGEKRKEFLVFDHKNSDGSKHRKELGVSGGKKMHRWIIENNFPDMFQILCCNCNWAKYTPGVCPHNYDKILGALSECG